MTLFGFGGEPYTDADAKHLREALGVGARVRPTEPIGDLTAGDPHLSEVAHSEDKARRAESAPRGLHALDIDDGQIHT